MNAGAEEILGYLCKEAVTVIGLEQNLSLFPGCPGAQERCSDMYGFRFHSPHVTSEGQWAFLLSGLRLWRVVLCSDEHTDSLYFIDHHSSRNVSLVSSEYFKLLYNF